MKPTIRVARPGDAAQIAAIYAPLVTDSWTSFELTPPGAAEFERRMAGVLPTHPWLVCVESECVLGYAYAGAHRKRAAYRWACETSVYVAAAHRRRGVGRALYMAVLDVVRAQRLGVALAGISLPNAASVGFHESLGFRPVGVYERVGHKFGRWYDVGWWQLLLTRPAEDAEATPAEPIPFANLANAPATRALFDAAAAAIRGTGASAADRRAGPE